MIAEVKKRALSEGYTNLEAKEGDALKSDLGKFDVCAANLPYQISSPFIFKLVSHPNKYRCAVLMFQKEFAERLVANAGDKLYCRLSVNAQLFCKISRVCTVVAANFNPPPKVDSVVVKVVPRLPRPQVRMCVCLCVHRERGTEGGFASLLSNRCTPADRSGAQLHVVHLITICIL
eukprot:GHVU01178322.1.p1 GENE.GHVU01178322.1~~GHVU01178322.1.p1  ORF type:complete len:176 (+),score=4.94 GHVU01178322.1:781-1308(+)